MERIRAFLESSTIHGLNYISTTRKYVRAFWMIVVLTGFTGAGYMIYTSFQSWADSPIKTTIETLPISEIKFPKVTVCPPKNTYTDLNYDLMLAENFTLTEDMRRKLIGFSKNIIAEHTFMDDLDMLQEEDRYYNWYYGYSKIKRLKIDNDTKNRGRLDYDIETSAISGVVTTQYFGEQFQPNLVEKYIFYDVKVYPPKSVGRNEEVALHFNLEKASLTGLSEDSWDWMMVDEHFLEGWLTSDALNFTPPATDRKVKLSRHINLRNDDDLTNNEMDSMPGFRLNWHYTGLGDNVTPDSKYSDSEENQLFIW